MSDLSAILALAEANDALDPGIYVELKDRDPRSEEDRQGEYVAFMRKHVRAARVYAVPNGTHIASFAGRRKRQKEGLISGEPDTGATWADIPTHRIEWKDGRGDPSPNQVEALNWYHRRGHPVAVCRTLEGALRWHALNGAPVPEIRG